MYDCELLIELLLMFIVQILEQVLLAEQYQYVVYLGDARGDFCPCTRLGPTDAVLARTAYPDGRPASLLPLLAAESAVIQLADGSGLQMAEQPAEASSSRPASATSAAAGSTSSSAAWTQGGSNPEGRTATLVRQLAADAADILNPTGGPQAPQPLLRPLLPGSQNGTAHLQRDDAVSQRRDHKLPGTSTQDDITTMQVRNPAHAGCISQTSSDCIGTRPIVDACRQCCSRHAVLQFPLLQKMNSM